MILNVSGRCDIVAFYTEWFMNRYRIGFVDVRNPFYKSLVSRIYFKDVDLILFCTKNPLPIIPYLKEIKKPVIFHITLTPYKKDIEPNVIDKTKIIEGIKKISEILGCNNVVVRYDPIFINQQYTLSYHVKAFTKLVKLLDGYINKIIISFIDDYKNVRKHKDVLSFRDFTDTDYEVIGKMFSSEAKKHNITVQTCAEEENLCEYGFVSGECMSKTDAYILTGKKYKKWASRKCNCVEMVDIGVYNSCKHFCKYCYANYNESEVIKNMSLHDKNSSLLVGSLESSDTIKVRKS